MVSRTARSAATKLVSVPRQSQQPADLAPAEQSALLLAHKLRIPEPTPPILRRQRVNQLIERAAAHRVAVICGPAGSGKTVACTQWVSSRDRRVGWLTLDSADRDPGTFWRYARAALSGLPGSTGSFPAASVAEFPAYLVAAAARFTEPVTLVLDDVHELAGGAVLASLDFVLRYAPSGLRLILCGRWPPRLGLARLRVSGDLAEVGSAELASTPEEAEEYFDMLGVSLDTQAREMVFERTEGWMAGLRMAAIRAAGGEQVVADYLRDEVLNRQSGETRLFMLRTSIVSSLAGELADSLTGSTAGARTLEQLRRENCLVDGSGTGCLPYRYHPMLRDLLAAELRRELPQEIPGLLGRAARWLAEHGDPIEAVRAAAAAQDWDYAAQVLVEAGATVLRPDRVTDLQVTLQQFPAARRTDDAAVAAMLGALRLWSGDPDGATTHLDGAARGSYRSSPDVQRVLEPYLAALRVIQAAGRPELGASLNQGWAVAEKGQRTAATLAEHRALGLIWFALGSAYLRAREIQTATVALERAGVQLAAAGLDDVRARVLGWQSVAEALGGNISAAERAAEAADDQHGPARAPGLAALARAEISLLRDDLSAAAHWLDHADSQAALPAPLPGEPDATATSELIRIRASIAAGDIAGARGRAVRLRGHNDLAGDLAMPDVLAAVEAEIALRDGDPAAARRCIGFEHGEPAWLSRGPGLVLHARLLLHEGDFDGALEVVEPCLDGAAEESTPLARIAALLVSGAANRRLGRPDTAAQALEQALAMAEPDGCFRPFLDFGAAVRSSLTVLVPPTSRNAGFARRILERFDCQGASAATDLDAPGSVPLTHSEISVLRFLPSQMTNEEIAQTLYLSINTVKTHLRSVYRKMGVSSRRQAIATGRRLRLL